MPAFVSPLIAPILTFAVVSILAQKSNGTSTLDTAKVFTSLSLFTLLSEPLSSLIMSLSSFMGGVGSEALGAAIAGTAILAGWAWWLPLIALVPLLEVVSVMIQVPYFRATGGKRFFKMAPLHHHFEKSGWPEPQVTLRFWLVSAVCVALAWGLKGGLG